MSTTPRVDGPKLANYMADRKAKAKAEADRIRANLGAEAKGDPVSNDVIKHRKARDHTSGYGYPEVTARQIAERRKAGIDD